MNIARNAVGSKTYGVFLYPFLKEAGNETDRSRNEDGVSD